MYDELSKRLRLVAQWADIGLVIPPSVCIEAADVIEELSRKTQELPRWIPVTELLPEEGRYLALCRRIMKGGKPYARILYFGENLESVDKYDFDGIKRSGWYYYDDEYGHIEVDTVTHWMPLPEPPSEVKA